MSTFGAMVTTGIKLLAVLLVASVLAVCTVVVGMFAGFILVSPSNGRGMTGMWPATPTIAGNGDAIPRPRVLREIATAS